MDRLAKLRWVAAGLWVALLVGCGEVASPESTSTPATDAPAGHAGTMTVEAAVAAIKAATPVSVTPEQVAEAFALNSRATDIQREMLEKALVGSVVEWNLRVYEVAFEEGHYKVTSQPIPIQSPDAIQLVRVVAFVQAQGPEDETFLRSVQTDDPVRLRGLVQGIRLRTIVAIGPAVVVDSPESAATPATGTT